MSQNCDVAIILKIDTNFHLSSSKSHVSPGDIGCPDIQSVPFWDLLSYTVMYGYKWIRIQNYEFIAHVLKLGCRFLYLDNKGRCPRPVASGNIETCLNETVIHPIICMLETWFIYQNIATVNVNLLICKPCL